MFYKMGALKSCTIFTGKHLCWSLFLIKLNKKRLQNTCLPENIAKFVRTPFFRAHLSASVTPPSLATITTIQLHECFSNLNRLKHTSVKYQTHYSKSLHTYAKFLESLQCFILSKLFPRLQS